MKAAIVGLAGPELGPAEARLLRDLPPAGVILFARNIRDPGQLAGLIAVLREVLAPSAVLMVDQEGGRVARLRPPHWRANPTAAAIGALPDPAAERAAWLTGALIGAQCAAAGFDVVNAPVLDLAVPGAHAVIGDRAYDGDPDRVARLAGAAAYGLLAAGVQPVAKHVPGHGRALVDSHLALPRVAAEPGADLAPFAACRHIPWAMTAHIVYEAVDPVLPATLSRAVLSRLVRGHAGFAGVLVSDDLAMQALSGEPGGLAQQAILAGCDLVLHCTGRGDDNAALLAACPAISPDAIARMARARAQAEAARMALDPDALAAERDRLFA